MIATRALGVSPASPRWSTILALTVICVPVRNEELLLPALIRACERLRTRSPVRLCLYLDSCIDGSEAIACAMATTSPLSIAIDAGQGDGAPNAGRARAAAFALGLRQMADEPGGVLLSTDADSIPAPDWLEAAMLALGSADVAAGLIVRPSRAGTDAQDRIELYYDRLRAHRRTIDPVPWEPEPGSHHASGANLAMRADAYRAAGGFRALASGEDAVFLDDAARAGLRVRHDRRMVVRTSARRDGRALGGLATALAAMDAGCPSLVPDPSAADWQYRAQRYARSAFPDIDRVETREGLGRMAGLSADHILGVARDCPNAEAFSMRIVPTAPGGERLVPLAEAELILGSLVARSQARAA